tara:strand:- start:63 stop:536 length:474 start_codon:yes stop_codon:yes gene_type:complete
MDGPNQRVLEKFPFDKEKIIAEVVKYNSQVLKLNIDPNPDDKIIELKEGSGRHVHSRHQVHKGNLFKDGKVIKIVALYNVNGPDDFQGGSIEFDGWRRFRIDNYGEPRGDADSHVPDWINEEGTLIIYPAVVKCEADIVVSGTVRRHEYLFMGDNYK